MFASRWHGSTPPPWHCAGRTVEAHPRPRRSRETSARRQDRGGNADPRREGVSPRGVRGGSESPSFQEGRGMFRSATWVVVGSAVLLGFAAPARADDDVKAEIEALKRQVRDQERKIRELEGKSLSRDEVTAAVERYLGDTTSCVLVGADDKGGKAGWPMGGAPFISEGPNKIAFHLRNQVRYEGFHYD